MKIMTERSKLLLVYFISMVGLALLNVFTNLIPSTASDNAMDLTYSLISQIVCMGLIPFFGAIWARRREDEKFPQAVDRLLTDYRYKSKLNPVCILLLIPMAISFFGVTRLMSSITVMILSILQYKFPISAGTIYTSAWDIIPQLLLTALLPAIFEEFTHRGLAMDALSRRGNEVSTVLLSGLLFALMHTNILQCFYAFVGGCVFGYLVLRSNSIIPSMVLHFCNNGLSVLTEYSSQYPDGALGFLDRINSFFYASTLRSLLFGVILVANLFLFLFLCVVFVRYCPKREEVKPVTLIKGRVYIDAFRPDGKPKLSDNVFLFATIVMTTMMTLSTYVWGVIR